MGRSPSQDGGLKMFAKRMDKLESSGIRKFFELKNKMKNPIDLSLGQAHFDVPSTVKEATIKAIQEGKSGYTVTTGVGELRDVIQKSLHEEGYDPETILITAGAEGGLVLSLLALADERVEVLVPDPYFATYNHVVRLAGSEPKWIDTYPDFRLTPDKLRKAVTDKTKILLFNSPNNPTGVSYKEEEIEALAKEAMALGLTVISDEVYDRFSYDHPHTSWGKFDSNAVVVRAFSKTLGMAGWRVGYSAGPSKILDQMTMLQQFTFICSNAPGQWGCIEAFKGGLPDFLSEYRKKRDFVVEMMQKDFKFHPPEGAFYLFSEYPKGKGDKFIQKCIENELLVVPGKAFSQKNTHFRISFATDDQTLEKGVSLLCKIAHQI
jgi:aspartate/methionine/tyrosine aminotransferase